MSSALKSSAVIWSFLIMPKASCATGAILCLGALLGSVGLAAEELPDIADHVQASVVSIAAERTDQTPQATGDKDQDADAAKSNLRQGSGMVLSADGYIVTTTSLVEKVGKITIVLSDGRQMTAQIMGRDPRTGIALLKAAGATGLTAVHFADAHALRRGTSVFSIGNVYGLQNSLSAGVIAAIRRASGPVVHLVLQTDMVVYPGSTGAPLFNMKGEVLGMFTSNYSSAGKRTGVGLAVSSNLIREVTDKLQKFGVVDRGWLGVQVRKTTDEEASALATEKGSGLMVLKVVDGGPAASAGLAPGDAIAMVNGQVMHDIVPFASAIANLPSGTDVTLGIARKSGRSDVHVKLGRLPDTQTVTATAPPAAPGTPEDKALACLRYVPSVGMTVAVACEE